MQRRTVVFWFAFVLLWLAHALGYLLHEYAHSIAAWVLGYKANPLALDYGHLSFLNFALLSDIDENVDYVSIFRAGKGYLVSLVAVSGVLFGNSTLYAVSRGLYSLAKKRNAQLLGLFAFLFCLMSIGNFWCYMPVRTFTTHGDMANVEAGLHLSPWWIVTVLGVLFSLAIWHLFAKLLPDVRSFLFGDERIPRVVLTIVSSFTLFAYYGNAGLHGYGETSHLISVFSSGLLSPVALVLCWPRKSERLANTRAATA